MALITGAQNSSTTIGSVSFQSTGPNRVFQPPRFVPECIMRLCCFIRRRQKQEMIRGVVAPVGRPP